MIVVECDPDEFFIKSIGFARNDKITHKKG